MDKLFKAKDGNLYLIEIEGEGEEIVVSRGIKKIGEIRLDYREGMLLEVKQTASTSPISPWKSVRGSVLAVPALSFIKSCTGSRSLQVITTAARPRMGAT